MASGAGLGESGLGELSQARRGRGKDLSLVDQVVPNFQEIHLGIAAQPPDIGFDHRARCLLGISPVAAEKERSNRGARREPLEVPLPRPGKNLVKVVDCENEVALRRCEESEITRCISPQAITSRLVRGVFARSPAMIAALPRKKANGEVSMRAIRTGTSSLMRVAFCASRIETGSGRPCARRNSAWDERGTLLRRAFPFAIRSARDNRMALKLWIRASSARLALSRKKSSSLGMRMDPAPSRGVAGQRRATLQPAMRYLNFSFKRASGVTMDTEGSRNGSRRWR
jgi:hypothetical protein